MCMTIVPNIDDIIILLMGWDYHLVHLGQVLSALDKHGLKIKEDKCEFGRKFVEYLGHIVGDGKLAVPEHRAAAMKEFKQPRMKKGLSERCHTIVNSFFASRTIPAVCHRPLPKRPLV